MPLNEAVSLICVVCVRMSEKGIFTRLSLNCVVCVRLSE